MSKPHGALGNGSLFSLLVTDESPSILFEHCLKNHLISSRGLGTIYIKSFKAILTLKVAGPYFCRLWGAVETGEKWKKSGQISISQKMKNTESFNFL